MIILSALINAYFNKVAQQFVIFSCLSIAVPFINVVGVIMTVEDFIN